MNAPRIVALAVSLALTVAASPSFAAKQPNSLATDYRVRQVVYDPNQVYEIVGTYGYQTSIEFAPDELVKVVSLGDSIAWQTVPYQNRLFLKPVEPNAVTNLTVITDKRTYYFKLNSSRNRESMTYLVRFHYPNANLQLGTGTGVSSAVTHQGFDPTRVNMDYGVTKQTNGLDLKRVFDDGQFTYFLFQEGTDIPTVYQVGADGTESLVNTRREGPYLVVERTADQFTLRSGKAFVCVKRGAARMVSAKR